MAKKGNDKDNLKEQTGCFLVLFLLLIIVTVIYIALWLIPLVVPLCFLIGFLVCWIRYQRNDKNLIRKKFWLTDEDQEQFKYVNSKLVSAISKKEEVLEAIEREGIHINKNGRISARSYRGQELQGALDNAEACIADMQPVYSSLREQPRRNWKTAKKHFSKAMGFGIAFFVWLGYLFYSTDNVVDGFMSYYSVGRSDIGELWSILDDDKDSINVKNVIEKTPEIENTSEELSKQPSFVTILVKGLFIMLAVYLVVWLISIIIFIIRYRKPPLVGMNNVDMYD